MSRTGLKISLLVISLAVLACAARAEALIVGPPPAGYQSLQDAISAAQAGDLVRVMGGTYTGQLILDKRLTLEGVGRPVLRGSGQGSVVIVVADQCVIRGFRIERSGGDLMAEDSGLLLKSNGNTIEDNELRDALYGIYLYHSRGNVIRRNIIQGRRELELGSRGAGLHVWNSPDNVFEDNVINDARDGMYIQSSPGNLIRRNRVYDTRYGLHYMNSDDNKFEDNIFSRNIAGAAIMYSRRIELRRNAFVHNRGFSSFGVLFQDCDENVAEDNLIADNATGIFTEALRKSVFRRNLIAENDLALRIFSSSTGNLYTENNFIANLSPLHLVGKRSDTRWQEGGRGNYWSDYDGYDLDGDGVGDAPHKVQNIFEYLEGEYPRLRLYLNSAAAQALATAEKTFPIIKGSAEADAAPLMKPVGINLTADPGERPPGAQALLGLISLAMVIAGAATIRKGRRR